MVRTFLSLPLTREAYVRRACSRMAILMRVQVRHHQDEITMFSSRNLPWGRRLHAADHTKRSTHMNPTDLPLRRPHQLLTCTLFAVYLCTI